MALKINTAKINLDFITELKPVEPAVARHEHAFRVGMDEVRDEPLNPGLVRGMLDDNQHRSFQTRSRARHGLDPGTRAVIQYFEQTVLDHTCGNHTKAARLDLRLRNILESYIESRARLAGESMTEQDIKNMALDIFTGVTERLPGIDVLTPEDDLQLYDMVRDAIDETTMDEGGITRTGLRKKLGRNHVSYIRRLDEIINQLLDSGEYGMHEGRLVALMRDSAHTERMPVTPGQRRRGRPKRRVEEKPIVREMDGRLTDFIPMPSKKKDKENANAED